MSNSRSRRPEDRYGSNLIRPGLLPGLLAAAVCIAGLWLNDTEWMIFVLFTVSILGAILGYFCIQALRVDNPGARRATTVSLLVLLTVIVIIYNPVLPFVLSATGTLWQLGQVLSGAVLFVAGVLVRTPSS